jgi:hypothetical protein
MTCEVRWKLGADEKIDRPAVAFRQVEQPPRAGVRQYFAFRVPLERQADALGLESVVAELQHQLADERLGAAADERHLRFADHDGLDHVQRGSRRRRSTAGQPRRSSYSSAGERRRANRITWRVGN